MIFTEGFKRGKYTKTKNSNNIEIVDKDKKTFDEEVKRRFDKTMENHANEYSGRGIKKYNSEKDKFEYEDNIDPLHKIVHENYTMVTKEGGYGIKNNIKQKLNSGHERIKDNKKTGKREYQIFDHEKGVYRPAAEMHDGINPNDKENDILLGMSEESSIISPSTEEVIVE